ncbi:MAG: ParB/RepB/Spo0J family partition protein [Phycisphaerales bacterium]
MADTNKVRKLGKGLAGLIGAPAAVPVPPQVDVPVVEDKSTPKSNTTEQITNYVSSQAAPATAAARVAVGGAGAEQVVPPTSQGLGRPPAGSGGHQAAAAVPSSVAAKPAGKEVNSFASGVPSASLPDTRSPAEPGEGGVMPYVVVRIDEVIANRFQPRQEFEREGLQLLSASIKRDGVMQPLVVRKVKSEVGSRKAEVGGVGGASETASAKVAKWELIAGERRLRAAQMAGLTHVPAIVVDVPDITAAMWAVVENVQRVDLGPVEKSVAYARLAKEFGLTQTQIAEQVGEDRTLVSHYIRLGELEPNVLRMVCAGMLSFGHAKVLNSPLVQPGAMREALANRAVYEAMSVRQLELMVQDGAGKSYEAAMTSEWTRNGPAIGGVGESEKRKAKNENEEAKDDSPAVSSAEVEHDRAVKRAAAFEAKAGVRDLEERIGKHLGTKVKIRTSGGGKRGVIGVEFFSLDHFEGLLAKMGVKKAD